MGGEFKIGAIARPDFVGGVFGIEHHWGAGGVFLDARGGYNLPLKTWDYGAMFGFKLKWR